MTSPTKEAIERVRRLLLIYEPGDLLDQYEVDAIEDLLASHDKLVEGLRAALASHLPKFVHNGIGRHDPVRLPDPEWVTQARALLKELGQ